MCYLLKKTRNLDPNPHQNEIDSKHWSRDIKDLMDSLSLSIYSVWELDRYLKMLFIRPELSNHFLEPRHWQIIVHSHFKTKHFLFKKSLFCKIVPTINILLQVINRFFTWYIYNCLITIRSCNLNNTDANQIESNRIESNRIESNRIESNQIKSNGKRDWLRIPCTGRSFNSSLYLDFFSPDIYISI